MAKKKLEIERSNLVHLIPFIIRRIIKGFNVGFSSSRKGSVEKIEIEVVEHGMRPLSHLFLQDFTACSESMEA